MADPTKTHIAKELAHGRPLISCRFDPSGKYIFFGSEDYRVWRWEVATDKKVELNHDAWVRAIAFSRDGKLVLTGGFDERMVWWPVEGDPLQPIRAIKAHLGWVRAVTVSPDNSLIATCGNDNLVKIWRMDDGSLVREMAGHERHVYNVAFHPDGKQLASGDLMGNLFHWDVETGKLVRKLAVSSLSKFDKTFKADIGGFRDLEFSADGSTIACAGITNVSNAFAGVGNPLVEAWDWTAGKQKIAHGSKAKVKGVCWGTAIHPDGFMIGAVGGSGGHLFFWKPDGKEEFHTLKLPSDARDLDLSPDGEHLVTAHYDGKIRVSKMAAKPSPMGKIK